jgi:hypothetical protein
MLIAHKANVSVNIIEAFVTKHPRKRCEKAHSSAVVLSPLNISRLTCGLGIFNETIPNSAATNSLVFWNEGSWWGIVDKSKLAAPKNTSRPGRHSYRRTPPQRGSHQTQQPPPEHHGRMTKLTGRTTLRASLRDVKPAEKAEDSIVCTAFPITRGPEK